MASTIKVKRSAVTATPTTVFGEPAISTQSGYVKLYVGNANNQPELINFLNVVGSGTATMNGALINSTATVSFPALTASMKILYWAQNISGIASVPNYGISARTNGTGFTFKSTAASDTSSIWWIVVDNN